jgi:hypothetical protein
VHPSEESSVFVAGVFQGGQVLSRHNKYVNGRLRVSIFKGHDIIIFEDNPGG